MAERKGGSRAGTRQKFRKNYRNKGKISLNRFFSKFEVGERALLKAEPAVQKGLYHGRFHAKAGTVVDKRGDCYGVKIPDGGKYKVLYVHPVHLKKVK